MKNQTFRNIHTDALVTVVNGHVVTVRKTPEKIITVLELHNGIKWEKEDFLLHHVNFD